MTETDCALHRGGREGRAREILGLEVEGRQHGFLSAAQTRRDSWAPKSERGRWEVNIAVTEGAIGPGLHMQGQT